MLWHDASCDCLCVQSFMSSHLHHFSYLHLGVLIWLQASVSLFSCFGTSFSAAPFRIMIASLMLCSKMSNADLDKSLSLPRSTVFPRKCCSICPLAPPFAYLQIWNRLIRQHVAPSFAGSPRCAFTLTKKVAVPGAILFRSLIPLSYRTQRQLRLQLWSSLITIRVVSGSDDDDWFYYCWSSLLPLIEGLCSLNLYGFRFGVTFTSLLETQAVIHMWE